MNFGKWVETNLKGASSSINKSFSGLNKELQGLSKIDLGTPNLNQIKLNTDQDLSPFVKGAVVLLSTSAGATAGTLFLGSPLAGAAVGAEIGQNVNQNLLGSRYDPSKDGGAIQKAVTGTTGDIQRETVNIAKGIQNATIVNTSDLQERAVDFADRNDLGRNPTLEKWAKEVTHTVEEGAAEATKIVEANAAGITSEAEKGAAMLTTAGENTADAFSDVYDLLTGKPPKEEGVGELGTNYENDLTKEDGVDATSPYPELESNKDDQMTEEERLAMIRRLLLNRYGREDTILGGGKDTKNRRVYAL